MGARHPPRYSGAIDIARAVMARRVHRPANDPASIPSTEQSKDTHMGSVIKKRRKRMAKKKHRKLLRKTRHQRRNKK